MRLDFSRCGGGKIASAEATKGHENRRMSAVAPLDPFGAATFGVVCSLNLLLQGESRLRVQ